MGKNGNGQEPSACTTCLCMNALELELLDVAIPGEPSQNKTTCSPIGKSNPLGVTQIGPI